LKKIPCLDVEQYDIDKEHLSVLSKEDALKYCAIPWDNIYNIITICVAEPTMELKIVLESLTGKLIKFIRDDHRIIKRKIQEVY